MCIYRDKVIYNQFPIRDYILFILIVDQNQNLMVITIMI